MATGTNITRRTRKSNEPEFKSKSDAMRALFRDGKSVKEVAESIGVGYAFAYGVAARAGFAKKAAKRRATRMVTIDRAKGIVTVMTDKGPVKVFKNGRVIMPTTAAPKVKAAKPTTKKATATVKVEPAAVN